VMLKIYDTAGQDEFNAVRDQYIRLGDGLIVCYSVTSSASFKELPALQLKISTLAKNAPVLLYGNKIDMEENREVSTQEGNELAANYGWKFLEGSAKGKINVTESFQEIVRSIRERMGEVTADPEQGGEGRRRRRSPCNLL